MTQAEARRELSQGFLDGYELKRLLRKTRSTAVYHATRKRDGLEVIAKFYLADKDAAEGHFEHEYRLLSKLGVAGAVEAVDLLRAGQQHVLILKRFPGVDLDQFMKGRPLDIETFLAIAVKLTAILVEVHARRVIHRDLKPTSVLVDGDKLDVCLADFGISVALERDHREIYDPGVLSGTLPYLAPEQTGRTTRPVDHRSDLYSLGATFYEMLSGQPPFTETEPLKLVHAHLARLPAPLSQRRRGVPEVLSALVARLLAKDPIDRYQSARGLLHDLERCQRDRQGFEIPTFELGQGDASEHLELPDRLYGRKAEARRLSVAFDRAARGGVELLLLHGPSGIGKTALIQSLQPQLADREGYFATGKFEQFRSNVPLLGVTQAFSRLVSRLLIEDEERLESWRHQLRTKLESSAAVLVPLIPELVHFVGPQPDPVELGALESRNRLLVALGRLAATLAAPAHPVVLFFDDLQWSDPISLRVIEQLVTASDARGLLVIGAYRSDEVEDDHPLTGLARRVGVAELPLMPLSTSAVTELICDALKVDRYDASELAASLEGRTDNNPLLIRQLLTLLAQEGALSRGPEGWTWSPDAVRKSGIPGDALGMIKAKLSRLSPAQREVLAAATCVGSRFEIDGLAAALEMRPADVLPHVAALADEGLLALSDSEVCFTHDRIEEGARHWLDPVLEQAYHRRIGSYLHEGAPDGQLAERLYDVVDHLNWTIDSEEDPDKLWEIASLDLQAGQAGLRASASAMAARHLEAGLRAVTRAEILEGQSSTGARGSNRDLALALGVQHARCVSLAGDYEQASTLFDAIMAAPLEPLEYAETAFIRLEACTIASRQEDAIHWGLAGLAKLGVRIPRAPGVHRVLVSLLRLKWAFRPKVRAQLDQLPPCEDPVAQLRMDLLARIVGPAYVVGGNLVPVIVVEAALESLHVGRTPSIAFYLALVCMLMAGVLGDHHGAAELADFSLELVHQPGAKRKGITVLLAYAISLHWTRPYADCYEGVVSAFELALAEGDLEYATYAIVHRAAYQSALGRPLDVVRRDAQEAARFAANTGMSEFSRAAQTRVRMSELLEGLSTQGEFDPDSFELLYPRCVAVNWAIQPLIFLAQPERALALSDSIASSAQEGLFGFYLYPEFVFYRAMAAAMCLDGPCEQSERRLLKTLRNNHRKLAKWAAVYADNLGPHVRLLEAELARHARHNERCLDLYGQAARAAAQSFPHIEALAWERLAGFMIARGWEELAQTPMRLALEGYEAWGAAIKVAQIEQEFPDLRHDRSHSAIPYTIQETVSSTTSAMSASLDVASVLKSTLGITRGQSHDDVVSRVLATAIENAGAQRGVLIQQLDGSLYVVVENNGEGSTGRISEPLPLSDADGLLPTSLVRLVARTGESRIINDAREDAGLASDSFAAANKILSVACVPILSQNQVGGVLYLENSLVSGVFTPDRLELLEHLAAQAAISLQSARLFDALRSREAQWRSLVEHAPDNIAIVDADGRIRFINRGVESDGRELLGKQMTSLFAPEYRERVIEAIAEVFETGENASFEAEVLAKTNLRRWWTTRVSPILRQDEVVRATLISNDDTEHRQLEGQLRQSQKMEAVGTLAGGVAHDFNNLLSVILGSAELARDGLYPAPEALDEIMSAAERASGLTRQLLAFSRKQVLQPRVLDLNESVNAMAKMLRRLIGEDLVLVLDLQDALGWVRVDPGQLEQVVLNLVVNARDAMPHGGEIRVRTSQSELSPAKIWRHDGLEPGLYVTLEIEDTGVGMDALTRERIFDPFFTTKVSGKGTGLGLSTVHGIVKQSGGFIEVKSEPGLGTTFLVYFPVVRGSLESSHAAKSEALPHGREVILLVEDEASVRKLMRTILSQQGYTVLEAADGEQAVKLAAECDWIDLLLTDVVLPGISGREVADKVLEKFRDMAVLYVSGYTDDSIMRRGVDAGTRSFLQKPFTRDSLARKVREALDE
ncbi:AAA family ATPase [Pseudenhygromyxa sp. WMMC2535]|uniref:AAA family ATPase n=1 Tax=Pseudenhygromyxa sp. WMMC2535 TaxID=2712867 RepID=UPI0015565EE4|nr:AAA family ATPase [Pseudenhygromyxa sp. WMMC2535]NVB36873.1 AAA family ATPase [Pseudenhygromyxa sp. WMMC2535]